MMNKASVFRFADIEARDREFSFTEAERSPARRAQGLSRPALLRNPQKLLPKDELLTAVCGDGLPIGGSRGDLLNRENGIVDGKTSAYPSCRPSVGDGLVNVRVGDYSGRSRSAEDDTSFEICGR